MAMQSPFPISLTRAEHESLEALARKYTAPYRDVVRAKVILYAAQGFSNEEISSRLDLRRQAVSKWRKRFFEERMDGLDELARRGRPPRFSPQYRH